MKTRPLPLFALLGLAAAVLGGCTSKPVARRPVPATPMAVAEARGTVDAALLQPSTTEFTLGPGDRVAIDVGGTSAMVERLGWQQLSRELGTGTTHEEAVLGLNELAIAKNLEPGVGAEVVVLAIQVEVRHLRRACNTGCWNRRAERRSAVHETR